MYTARVGDSRWTAVDLALSGVILLLIGVAVQAALHLHHRAGLHLPRLRRQR